MLKIARATKEKEKKASTVTRLLFEQASSTVGEGGGRCVGENIAHGRELLNV